MSFWKRNWGITWTSYDITYDITWYHTISWWVLYHMISYSYHMMWCEYITRASKTFATWYPAVWQHGWYWGISSHITFSKTSSWFGNPSWENIIRNIIAQYHMISYYIINVESLNICYHMWYQHILEASTLLERRSHDLAYDFRYDICRISE